MMANRQNHPGNLPPLQPSAPVLRGGGRQPKHRPPLRRRPFHPRLERRIPLHRKGIRFVDHHQLKTAVKPPCLMGRRRRKRAVRPDPAALPVQNAYRDIRKSPFQPRRQLFHHIPARRNPQNVPALLQNPMDGRKDGFGFSRSRNRPYEKPFFSRPHRFQAAVGHPFLPRGQGGKAQIDPNPTGLPFLLGEKEEKGRAGAGTPEKRQRSQLTHWLPHRPHRERQQSLRPRSAPVATPAGNGRGDFDAGQREGHAGQAHGLQDIAKFPSSMGSANSLTKAFTSSQSRERPAKSGRRNEPTSPIAPTGKPEGTEGEGRANPSLNAGAPNA